jgi:hypothetical protein
MAIILDPNKYGTDDGKLEHFGALKQFDPYEDERHKADSLAYQMYGAEVQGTQKGPAWGFKTPHGFYMAPTVSCLVHPFAKPVFSCKHCPEQDPVHPEGIILSERGFYVCKTCFGKMESRRRWKYWEELTAQCHHCIKAEVDRILNLDPTKFTDMMNLPLLEKKILGKLET